MSGTFKPAARIAWRRVDDAIVLLDMDTRAYYSLNEVGARIWELLAGGHPAEKAADAVAREYGASPRTVRKDIESFLKALRKGRLLEPAG